MGGLCAPNFRDASPLARHSNMTTQLQVLITDEDADLLYHTCCRSFVRHQRDRFELLAGPDPLSGPSLDGTLYWCDTRADALLLRAYESAAGFETAILGDFAEDYADDTVVLSSRTWPTSPETGLISRPDSDAVFP